MNCGEVRGRAPLYLSGELDGPARQAFDAHLAACPECELEIEAQALVDERLAAAIGRESPDTARIAQLVRGRISASRSRRRWIAMGAVAAGLLLAFGLTYGFWSRLVPAPRWYADAARDHRAEVVDGQPRRWQSGATGIGAVAAQYGLSFAQASALAPAGYSLDRAKTCGIDGRRMLHLVFTKGGQTYSVYLGPDTGHVVGLRMVRRDGEQVAGFETGSFRALVVMTGPAAECEEFARLAAARL